MSRYIALLFVGFAIYDHSFRHDTLEAIYDMATAAVIYCHAIYWLHRESRPSSPGGTET